MEKTIEKTKQNIEMFGVAIMAVMSDGTSPAFAYTTGLTKNYNHPEVIIFGVGQEGAQLILNEVAKVVGSGAILSTTDKYKEFTNGFDSIFVPVSEENKNKYFLITKEIYGNEDFHALQLVWSDADNKFPWDAEFDERLEDAQPILGIVLTE